MGFGQQPGYDRPRELGYVELDLVHHCGKSGRGDFCYTLTFTEVATGYTELRSLRNKAQIWTLQALVEIMENLPFKVVHLHCDNGSEFINGHLRRFTLRENLDFSRSRAYHKNDAAYAESKNWSMVRRYTGYQRYDSEEEWMVLEELMKLISIKHNYFIPTMKLVSKERVGLKVRKRYDVHIPYERLQKSELVSRESKERLEQYKRSLDYFAIQKRIIRLSEKLEQSYRNK
ncbi:MAG: hypothetical protein DDT22_01162 [candidate division WS2 bacterium]|nr:hypothetical protein [Candidatus Lithacetigena glycinireducens]